MPKGEVVGYDVRVHKYIQKPDGEEDETLTVEEVKQQLMENCSKWCFQLEQGDNGYVHYQIRMKLKKKRMRNPAAKLFDFKQEFCYCRNNCAKCNILYFEPTATNAFKTENEFYVMKKDTRIEGAWTDRDEEIAVKYIPRQYREIADLRPFQQTIKDMSMVYHSRGRINYICDSRGNCGKTTIGKILKYYHDGLTLPVIESGEQLIQSVCNMYMAKNIRHTIPIFVDIPRSFDQKVLGGIYAAIEVILSGDVYDLRHKYREWSFDVPNIFVFSNHEPDMRRLSRDRWVLWTINGKYELVPYQRVNVEQTPECIITDDGVYDKRK
jgi:hypothetical protein